MGAALGQPIARGHIAARGQPFRVFGRPTDQCLPPRRPAPQKPRSGRARPSTRRQRTGLGLLAEPAREGIDERKSSSPATIQTWPVPHRDEGYHQGRAKAGDRAIRNLLSRVTMRFFSVFRTDSPPWNIANEPANMRRPRTVGSKVYPFWMARIGEQRGRPQVGTPPPP